jgi:ribosome-associated toxin RatA of RatAB toxin-antitoxin module
MKWLIGIIIALVCLGGLVAVVGWLLPVKHEASLSAEFRRPAGEVYALVADVRAYPAWWSEISKVEMLSDAPGRVTFREHLSTGPVVMTVREAVPPDRFVTVIDDPGQPFGGSWTFEIQPTPAGGARLTITERGEIYNPIFRALARFVFGYTGTMDSFLAAAAHRFG